MTRHRPAFRGGPRGRTVRVVPGASHGAPCWWCYYRDLKGKRRGKTFPRTDGGLRRAIAFARQRVPLLPEGPVVLFDGTAQGRAQPVIYGLVDPREGDRIRYVGSSLYAGARYQAHLTDARRERAMDRRAVWIRDLLAADLAPSMILLEIVESEVELFEREEYWIGELRHRRMADLNTHLRPTIQQARRRA